MASSKREENESWEDYKKRLVTLKRIEKFERRGRYVEVFRPKKKSEK